MPALTRWLGPTGESLDIQVGGQLDQDLTSLWLLLSAVLVFFLQIGFAMLESGSVRYKSTKNILLKNVLNTMLGALVWWAVGHSFAAGACSKHTNPIIGLDNFFSGSAGKTNTTNYWALWFFGWVFAATSVTIPSGALAERCQLRAYLAYTFFQVALVYPLVVHAVWSQAGWLSPFRIDCGTGRSSVVLYRSVGTIDYAGSANVHMVGGAAALMGAIMIGPRLGRFSDDGYPVAMSPCNPNLQVLGTLILWMGWYGFNMGSSACMYGCMTVAGVVAANTTLAAASGGLTAIALTAALGYPGDISAALFGILSGLVSITSGCAVVQSYAAVIVGAVAACVWLVSSKVLRRLRIDDPLDAIPVHFCCGIWGVIQVGFFATKTSVAAAYPMTGGEPADWGVFYGGKGYQLGVQLLAVVSVAAWALSMSALLFGLLNRLGWLRVSEKEEERGLDHAQSVGTGVNLLVPHL